MEQTIMMVMQTVQAFGEKCKTHKLTEYEVLMYEQCCNMVATFARIQNMIGQG
jgi:roadblock/LC7 domain-containing protein